MFFLSTTKKYVLDIEGKGFAWYNGFRKLKKDMVMTRKKFEELVFDTYNVRADYPFEDDLVTGVFRHENGKWFALAMNIGERKIGHDGDEKIDVVNLKCAPR